MKEREKVDVQASPSCLASCALIDDGWVVGRVSENIKTAFSEDKISINWHCTNINQLILI